MADIQPQHYAFLVDDAAFDATHRRILERGIEHFADPNPTGRNQIDSNNGGRGFYVLDPAGHGLEVLTRADP